MRPRIRTIKPEFWQDERVGALSRDARVLLVGLVTMADDEGRIRALPAAIVGHVFPYDGDAPKRLERWLEEVSGQGIVLRYVCDGIPYVAFRHWRRHQRINRATASTLPPPPDTRVQRENSVETHGAFSEDSLSTHDSRARARIGSERNGTDLPPDVSEDTPLRASGMSNVVDMSAAAPNRVSGGEAA